MAQLVEVVGGGETAGAGAHDGHTLAAALLHEALGLPCLLFIVLHGKTLEVADAHGIVDVAALAAGLAQVVADMAQHQGEGHLLADDGHGIAGATLADGADVGGDVDMSGALGRAGHHVIGIGGILVHETHGVHDGAGGAHLDAGAAETAAGVDEGLALGDTGMDAGGVADIVQHLHAALVLAGADAAAAADAAGEQVGDEGVLLIGGNDTGLHTPILAVDAHDLIQALQLALTELGAAGALRGVGSQHQFHRSSADGLSGLTLGVDHHALFHDGGAGGDGGIGTVDAHAAQAATTLGLQVRVVTQMGDINPRIQCRMQNRLTLAGLDGLTVDRQFDHIFIVSLCVVLTYQALTLEATSSAAIRPEFRQKPMVLPGRVKG